MKNNKKIKNRDTIISPAGIGISAAFHLILFLASTFLVSFWYSPPRSNTVMVSFEQLQQANPVKEIQPVEETEAAEEPEETEPAPEPEPEEKTVQYTLNPSDADTSQLKQVYSEPTRGVRIKYPAGWTFMDQNVKGKLDAVTFWSASSKYDSPPYIFLEVKDKYLFNPARYTETLKTDYYTAYYNQPEELAGQISQVFYFRTDDDKDFSIKLIVKGRDNFEMFQKEFFGMVKTFRFGSSLF